MNRVRSRVHKSLAGRPSNQRKACLANSATSAGESRSRMANCTEPPVTAVGMIARQLLNEIGGY